MKKKVLIACEESQAVANEFRKMGIEAWSCDTEPCSGGHPEYHIQDDVMNHLHKKWDMIIAFPPCTDLAISGARWFKEKIKDGRQQRAIDFFLEFTKVDCEYVAIENSIGIMSTHYRKPDQIIQPWQFGDGEVKSTCIWLKNLPPLEPTNIVDGRKQKVWRNVRPGPDRSKIRSKTYPGIAKAMADQWGKFVL